MKLAISSSSSSYSPVGLFFSTNPSLFSFFLLALVFSLLLFSCFLLLQFQGLLLYIELAPCLLQSFRFLWSTCMPIFIVIRKCGEEWLIRRLFYPNGNFSACSGYVTVSFDGRYWRVRNVVCMIRNGFVSNVSPFD